MASLAPAEQVAPSSRGDVTLGGQGQADQSVAKALGVLAESRLSQGELGALDDLQLQQGLEMFGAPSFRSAGVLEMRL